MEEQMTVEAYLAQGGVVTSPVNVSSRYRAEVLKIMATFVDSSLAGAAGFADTINAAPGLRERIAAARIVLEKTQNAERVLGLMGEFGANSERYADSHPWSARLPRSAPSDAVRSEHDMRLSVFNFPLEGWTDAVVMNVVMGHAVVVQMSDLVRVSYQPLAIAFRETSEVETRHVRMGEQGLGDLVSSVKADSIEVVLGVLVSSGIGCFCRAGGKSVLSTCARWASGIRCPRTCGKSGSHRCCRRSIGSEWSGGPNCRLLGLTRLLVIRQKVEIEYVPIAGSQFCAW